MQSKTLAAILILSSIVLASLVYSFKVQEDKHIEALVSSNQGSCFINGVCLYEQRSYTTLILGWAIAVFLFALGIYSYFFDKTQKQFIAYQQKISTSLQEAQKKTEHEDKFKAFLAGFKPDEQKVLTAVKEQDGILQSTLRYRTGLSKATLSLILKNFEEKNLVTRQVSGKTNKVFWKKVY
ncbi:MarR family transcriptional regulator [Candidatus Woesearchaeota archaeon]|nr:MarR family transcriptional regulator [Candidatus Woesearchaeota archaeon]